MIRALVYISFTPFTTMHQFQSISYVLAEHEQAHTVAQKCALSKLRQLNFTLYYSSSDQPGVHFLLTHPALN